jgi:dGTPase
MRAHGGFEHNRQSLRIVEELEEKYPGFHGLNLTWEVREGLIKHQSSYDQPGPHKGFSAKSPSLEAQIANLADELIYSSHDLDDGLETGLLLETELRQHVQVFAQALETVRAEHGPLSAQVRHNFIVRCIIDAQVRDVVETSAAAILASGVKTADEVRRQARPLVRYSPARRKLNAELNRYLYQHLYANPVVAEPNRRAGKMLLDLFQYFAAHTDEIGASSRKRARQAGWPRAICDYLSGMTDRFAIAEHQRLFGLQNRA